MKGFEFKVTEGEELQKVFQTFEKAGDKNNFPKMMDYDPLARYMCLAPGMVLGKKGISTSAICSSCLFVSAFNSASCSFR